MSDDQLETVLAAQPWRLLCALDESVPRAADPILPADNRLDSEAHVTLCHELDNAILPGLAADGFVEFVSSDRTVWRGPNFEIVRPLFDRSPEQLRHLDAGPFAYDEDSETVRYDPEQPVEPLAAALADERDDTDVRRT
jgi:hypothetical protein